MKVVNIDRNTIVAEKMHLATSFFSRLTGLMFQTSMAPGHALALLPCNSVHTCFMRFPIDVLFADREGRVLKIKYSMRPFRFSPVVRKAYLVLEMPAGQLAASGTRPGDKISIVVTEEIS